MATSSRLRRVRFMEVKLQLGRRGRTERKGCLYVIENPTEEAVRQAEADHPERLLIIPVKPMGEVHGVH